MVKFISVTQAAEMLRVSGRRVRALIAAKRLPAQQIGGVWIINATDLKLVRERKPGRPPLKKKGG